jgi:hypothetical protein
MTFCFAGLTPPDMDGSTAQTEYLAMPEQIIVDLHQAFQTFQSSTEAMGFFEHANEEVLTEVLLYLTQANSLRHDLIVLSEDFGRCYPQDAALIGQAIHTFAMDVYSQIEAFRLYSQDGLLFYTVGPEWIDSATPVFTKSHSHIQ